MLLFEINLIPKINTTPDFIKSELQVINNSHRMFVHYHRIAIYTLHTHIIARYVFDSKNKFLITTPYGKERTAWCINAELCINAIFRFPNFPSISST